MLAVQFHSESSKIRKFNYRMVYVKVTSKQRLIELDNEHGTTVSVLRSFFKEYITLL